MADIVNLRMARKRKARAEREREAAANRAAHGVPKAASDRRKVEEDRARSALDGHFRGKPDLGEKPDFEEKTGPEQ